jgi:hypothetical protein
MEEQNVLNLPNPEEFYLKSSLYAKYGISENLKNDVFDLLYSTKPLDAYCVQCESVSVFSKVLNLPMELDFRGTEYPVYDSNSWKADFVKTESVITAEFNCSREKEHKLVFYIRIKDNILQKIGQFPSLADLSSFDILKYKKSLGIQFHSEFNKAIGLNAHGVGVGAFVYLRRIIENLIITPAHSEAKKGLDWDELKYQSCRVKEKIKMLETHLPNFLTSNPIIYSIISKGIHELSEDECRKYFPILRSSIELILTQLEEKRKTEEKVKELTQKLNDISSTHK